MSKIRHPGLLADKERQNLESLQYNNPLQYMKVEFDFSTNRTIGVLPKGAILDYSHLLYIEDYFDVASLRVGTASNSNTVLSAADIDSNRLPVIAVGGLNGQRTIEDFPLYIGFSSAPTKGRGWMIIKYVLWSRL